jgi:hypothetical protein
VTCQPKCDPRKCERCDPATGQCVRICATAGACCNNGQCVNTCPPCHRCDPETGQCVRTCGPCQRCQNGQCVNVCSNCQTCVVSPTGAQMCKPKCDPLECLRCDPATGQCRRICPPCSKCVNGQCRPCATSERCDQTTGQCVPVS